MMIHVRQATPADRDAWLTMRCDLWPDGNGAEHSTEIDDFWAGKLADPLAVLLATDESGNAVGFAELSIRAYAEGCVTDRVAYLEGWYVAPEARGGGVGRALIDAAEAWALERGCTEFASDALLDNDVSAAAHRALGFEEVEQIRCFKKTLSAVSTADSEMGRFARPGEIVIRHARMSDADAIARLVTELGYRTAADQMQARLQSILSKPEYSTLVALVSERVAGFIGTMVRPSYEADGLYGQIMTLVVSRDHRRRGVGRMLVHTIESMLLRRGVSVLVVNTANHRADAHAFYEHQGFSFTGRRYRKLLGVRA